MYVTQKCGAIRSNRTKHRNLFEIAQAEHRFHFAPSNYVFRIEIQ